jgi:maleylacetoacetate isomerase
MKLYQFWRSIASYRVRMVMNLKALNAEVESVDLLKGHQLGSDYSSVNPQKLLPSLMLDDGGPPLFQSMAIMEYLE